MRKLVGLTFAFILLLAGATHRLDAAKDSELEVLKQKAKDAREAFIKVDPEIARLFDSSAGYAIFGNIGKGGFIFAGAHGKGLVYDQGKLIGKASMTQATVGAQIGGQVYREVIFFENEAAIRRFKESGFEMNAQVSAVAAAEGASRNARYREGVIVFTDSITGLMAEASVGGQKFKFTAIEE